MNHLSTLIPRAQIFALAYNKFFNKIFNNNVFDTLLHNGIDVIIESIQNLYFRTVK